MRRRTGLVRNERGATIAFVAVSLAALVGMAALAVDLGMLIKTQADMQRAAEASALAGASAYQNNKPFEVIDLAYKRALSFAGQNYVGGEPVDTMGRNVWTEGSVTYVDFAEGQIQVIPAEEKVRVILHREGIGTWFARILGRDEAGVAAKAAAIAATDGATKCVKPFAIPDIWSDADNDANSNRVEDLGPGQGPNSGERWEWGSSASDRYRAWSDPNGTGEETGYGSSFRNNITYEVTKNGPAVKFWDDYGRPIVLKKSNPQHTASPSFFQPWVLPGSSPGAADYRENIATCNPAEINVNQEYSLDPGADTSSYDNKPGNMIGPTKQGMDDLIDQDPQACWADIPHPTRTGWVSGEVRKLDGSGKCTQPYVGWESSPRVIHVPLFHPEQLTNGRTKLKFSNIAVIFIEDQKGRHEPVVGRFMYFAKGTGGGPTTGPLIKKLRLVE